MVKWYPPRPPGPFCLHAIRHRYLKTLTTSRFRRQSLPEIPRSLTDKNPEFYIKCITENQTQSSDVKDGYLCRFFPSGWYPSFQMDESLTGLLLRNMEMYLFLVKRKYFSAALDVNGIERNNIVKAMRNIYWYNENGLYLHRKRRKKNVRFLKHFDGYHLPLGERVPGGSATPDFSLPFIHNLQSPNLKCF